MTVYDMVYEDDQPNLYSILLNPSSIIDPLQSGITRGEFVIVFSRIRSD